MEQYRIAIILAYFGNLHNYFQLWLDSAGCNSDFDFYIITDGDLSTYQLPGNVKSKQMSFADVRDRVGRLFPYKVELSNPYKLCDYKPLYGLIFSDIVKDYDFWGHCDPDIIWGDLKKFITNNVLDNYDKIYFRGHLSLTRNNDFVNKIPLQDSPTSLIKCKHVFTSKYSAYYDEGELLMNKFLRSGCKLYDSPDCADVQYRKKPFAVFINERILPVCMFMYDNGRIYGKNENGEIIRDYSYLHLQKRNMVIRLSNQRSTYAIIPNAFVETENVDRNLSIYSKNDKKYEKRQSCLIFKRRIRNVKNGALFFRVMNLLSKMIYGHN